MYAAQTKVSHDEWLVAREARHPRFVGHSLQLAAERCHKRLKNSKARLKTIAPFSLLVSPQTSGDVYDGLHTRRKAAAGLVTSFANDASMKHNAGVKQISVALPRFWRRRATASNYMYCCVKFCLGSREGCVTPSSAFVVGSFYTHRWLVLNHPAVPNTAATSYKHSAALQYGMPCITFLPLVILIENHWYAV